MFRLVLHPSVPSCLLLRALSASTVLDYMNVKAGCAPMRAGPKGEPKCVEELQKLCGKPWGSQHSNKTACLDCVIAHEKGGFWTKVNCTRAEVSKFC